MPEVIRINRAIETGIVTECLVYVDEKHPNITLEIHWVKEI